MLHKREIIPILSLYAILTPRGPQRSDEGVDGWGKEESSRHILEGKKDPVLILDSMDPSIIDTVLRILPNPAVS